MKPYTYLLIDLGCILVPLLCSFIPYRAFYKDWKYFFPANLIVSFVFIIWDIIFTEGGVWGFNPDYLCGIEIYNLPLEEVLFFICIPYACVFGYFAFTHYYKKVPKINSLVWLMIGLCFILIGLLNLEKAYTTTTFISLGAYLLISYRYTKRLFIHSLGYLLIVPFFFLANGILTGSFLESPIVWYNDEENLGIRIFTIPVEDIFYGYLLILMNLKGYEYLKEKKNKS